LFRAANKLLARLWQNAELAYRAYWRQREARRHARLFGPRPHRPLPEPGGSLAQSRRLADIVGGHCRLGNAIVSTHQASAIKLDAAEYLFSSMLDDLRGVMTALPTRWEPERFTRLPPAHPLPTLHVHAA